MLQALKDIFSVKDLRKKLLYIVLIIVLYRLGTFITVPGIDKIAFMNEVSTNTGILGTINIISGGAFSRLSIFAMTIGPYITASIILNLLQIVIPSLEKLAREGETGRKKLQRYTKYLTVVFAIIESVGLFLQYRRFLVSPLTQGAGVVMGLLLFVTSLMAGTALLMWLADKITETNLGNGVSTIIFVSIVSGAPAGAAALYTFAKEGIANLLVVIAFVAAMVALIAGVIFVQQAERRIPVNYAKRVVGRKMMGGQNTHIPLKVAMAGVIPIIFAMSFMMFPPMIINLCTKGNPTGFWKGVHDLFSLGNGNPWFMVIYALIYMGLIVAFTFFYTTIIVNPVEMSNNLKKNGGFIPGIRAGKQTTEYITNVLNNITWAGAIFLALVAILPILVQALMPGLNVGFGGTSILIVVSVALEILKQLETQMVSRHYKGFLE